MSKCKYCGADFDGASCPNCGAAAATQAPTVQTSASNNVPPPVPPTHVPPVRQMPPPVPPVGQMPPVPPYQQPVKNKLKWWQIVLIAIGALVAIVIIVTLIGVDEESSSSGTGVDKTSSSSLDGSSESGEEPLTESEISQMYTEPKKFKGRSVTLYGKIFSEPENDSKGVSFHMYASPDDYERNTVIEYKNPSAELKSGDYVKVVGTVYGEIKGTNLFGGSLSAPKITASSVEVVDYITAVRPTIKSVEVGKEINQSGYKCTINKVEFAEKETRVYVTFENGGKEKFDLHVYSTKIVQNGTQFDIESNHMAEYPKLQTSIMQDVKTEGILTFGKMDQASFKLYIKGSSEDYKEKIEEYVFDITVE